MEQLLKQQYRVESFDDFGLPASEICRIVGRVINISPEDAKLKEPFIGLININEESSTQIYKVQLNTGESQPFSVFEGEIIIAEGFPDSSSSKFNVNRIFKPLIMPPPASHTLDSLKKFNELSQSKDMQLMIACGPFTTDDSLSYQPLKDLLEVVKRDRPHGLILMGPFLDQLNQDIFSGNIFYESPDTKDDVFVDYEELF